MELSKQTVRRLFGLAAAIIVLFWGLNHFGQVSALFSRVLGILSPCILGFCIAFVMNLLLRPLEQLWNRVFRTRRTSERLRRPLCLLLSVCVVLGVLFAVCFIVLPRLQQTLSDLIAALPDYAAQLQAQYLRLSEFMLSHGVDLPALTLNADVIGSRVSEYLSNHGQLFVNTAVTVTTSIFSGVINLVVAFVFSLYMLAQKETLCAQARRFLIALLGESRAARVLETVSLVGQTFTNFATGQLTEAMILGVLCLVGMLILRIPYASVISVLVGFTALIPIFGAFIGAAIGAILILPISPLRALGFLVFLIVLQQLEGNLIYPRVVGKSVGLPGIWVLAAVTIGGGLFGVVGMLLGVPICSVVYTLVRELVHRRLDTVRDTPTDSEPDAPVETDSPAP